MRSWSRSQICCDIAPYLAIRQSVLFYKYAGYNFGTQCNSVHNIGAELFFNIFSTMNIIRLQFIKGDQYDQTYLSLYSMLL